ncbi:hypothetical protein [Fibrella aquatilis]|uniref:Uncharacterized protein n=1 Tax=Fibrella aquatilis TaxID=2817059 RepID=A0A939JX02_9BACT|nr:hypothetical protein [Fibrella aquatilis]MBO0932452.1 hypothetical protein [Fibrella aquatilis]
MEESGHYYSVYYVSIAVGFLNRIARQHAFFAQMPDEVSMLDATDLEVSYLFRTGDIPSSRLVPNSWRLRVEHGLHALTGRSAAAEQERTRQLLLATRDTDFVRLGLLLHRFGDTYAHTQIDHPDILYFADPAFPLTDRAGHGHLRHGHTPDEPWGLGRRALMRRYLTDLYQLFDTMAQRNPMNLRPTLATNKVSLAQVIDDFSMAEQAVDIMIRRRQEACVDSVYDGRRSIPMACFNQDAGAQREYITVLRRRITERTGGISFDPYEPEDQDLLTWQEFRERYRASYPELNQYNDQTIRDAVRQINAETNTIPSPAF